MTRREAIRAVAETMRGDDERLCLSAAERLAVESEMRLILLALGVPENEINQALGTPGKRLAREMGRGLTS